MKKVSVGWQRFKLVLGTTLILFPLLGYTYLKGCEDGVLRYKRSKNFMLTLYSMYMFGVGDGCKGGSLCGGKK